MSSDLLIVYEIQFLLILKSFLNSDHDGNFIIELREEAHRKMGFTVSNISATYLT